jgi:hypothetical protein
MKYIDPVLKYLIQEVNISVTPRSSYRVCIEQHQNCGEKNPVNINVTEGMSIWHCCVCVCVCVCVCAGKDGELAATSAQHKLENGKCV